MLLDEARIAARLHHPNVVATLDVCSVDDSYFLVMDYVDGFQLLDLLEHETARCRAAHQSRYSYSARCHGWARGSPFAVERRRTTARARPSRRLPAEYHHGARRHRPSRRLRHRVGRFAYQGFGAGLGQRQARVHGAGASALAARGPATQTCGHWAPFCGRCSRAVSFSTERARRRRCSRCWHAGRGTPLRRLRVASGVDRGLPACAGA